MSSTISGRVAIHIDFQEVFTSVLQQGAVRYPIDVDVRLPNGTSTGQIDLAYGVRPTGVAASTTTVYDLAGSLADLSGDTITFAEVTTICIRNRSTAAVNRIHIGPDATNGFGVEASNVGFWADASDRNIIAADFDAATGDGSWIVYNCRGGVAVAAGSTDELAVITQSGSSANTWDIVILGRSA